MKLTYDDVVSICDAHGICLPVDCVELVVAIVEHVHPDHSGDGGEKSAALDEVIEALKNEREIVTGSVSEYNTTEYSDRLDAKEDAINDCIARVEHMKAALASNKAAAVAVGEPNELQLVPKKLTPLMADAFSKYVQYAANNIYGAWAAMLKVAPPAPIASASEAFQSRVQPWMLACFGAEIAADKMERNHRFFEESTETVQANGMTRSEAHQLVDYVYDRPVGELHQEIGGVMVTLAALCLASGIDMHEAGEVELARVWTKIEKIRAKQAAKPKHSPLPESTHPAAAQPSRAEVLEEARGKVSAIPTRTEQISGQSFKYVKLHEVLDALDALKDKP
jgi:NTP pyrophosphatase (non-canonical NTP hydrolase)